MKKNVSSIEENATLKRLIPALLLLSWFGAMPLVAKADVSSANQNRSAAAFQGLDTLARETRAQGDLPRLSNPAHAKVLDRLWNVEATLGRQPYRSADVPALIAIGANAGAVLKTYALFTPQNGSLPDTAANTFKYQDEIARAGAYLLHVHAAQLEAITDFIAVLPADQMNKARRDGLRQMRLGIMEQFTGLTLMLRSPNLRSENRLILLNAFNASAIPVVAATSLADRTAMATQIDTILPELSGLEREKAQALKSLFMNQNCGGLCAMDQ
ncbi:hypothetical protein [Agrobacterium sp. LMR679]|uniref:hypothetical protein n=1 Tax=Agrobacterium sp. LMR679 TaxID=3014335 RepID=UPI0022AEE0B3|nr:hypothetical protein [Agrobacterium sp. LMR679]MCZ4075478.1 hypothetical protein [Agrobacterium sp. LMR679]